MSPSDVAAWDWPSRSLPASASNDTDGDGPREIASPEELKQALATAGVVLRELAEASDNQPRNSSGRCDILGAWDDSGAFVGCSELELHHYADESWLK